MMNMKRFASACSALTGLASPAAFAQTPAAPAATTTTVVAPAPAATTTAPSGTAPSSGSTAPSSGSTAPSDGSVAPESAPADPTRSAETATPETVADTPPVETVAVERSAPPPPQSAPVPTPQPEPVPVPQTPYMKRYVPEHLMGELGLFGGVMFPSKDHQLFDSAFPQSDRQPFKTAGELGVRFAFYPLSFLGLEAEAAVMPSKLEDGSHGGLWALRGHGILQWPGASVTPFVLVGGGALGASSNEMGNDIDRAFHFGLGIKAALDEHVTIRLDVRDTLHAGYPDVSTAHSPEVLFGISFVPKRRKPDFDKDGVLDMRDQCPSIAGPAQGCPPPDTDRDNVPDEADECKDVAGVSPSGCPDQDADNVLDRVDHCIFEAGPAPGGCPEAAPPAVIAEPPPVETPPVTEPAPGEPGFNPPAPHPEQ